MFHLLDIRRSKFLLMCLINPVFLCHTALPTARLRGDKALGDDKSLTLREGFGQGPIQRDFKSAWQAVEVCSHPSGFLLGAGGK